MKQSEDLSTLKPSDEDDSNSFFEFDDHALENLSNDFTIITIIADWVVL